MDWVSRFRSMSVEPPAIVATPDDVIRRLLAGNARFIQDVAPDVAPGSTVPTTDPTALVMPPTIAPRQSPFCAILGCSDARVPSELVFEAGPNEFFVVRVAGNVLGDECLGSIEYALHSFRDSLKLLLVLGHTGCGAVTAAVDAYMTPTRHKNIAFTRSLRAVINHTLIAVRSAAMALDEYWGTEVASDPGYRAALVEISVYLNAALTAFHLQEELQPEENFGARVVYGVFDVSTCRVIGPDLDPNTDDTSQLAAAPLHPGELATLGQIIASSPMVARHLTVDFRQKRYPLETPQ